MAAMGYFQRQNIKLLRKHFFSSFFLGGGAVGEVFEIILEMFLEGVNFSCVQFFWG